MNILLINHYAGSPRHGMEYRPFYMAREWVKMGHQVTIIGASYSHLRSEQPKIVGNYTQQYIEGIRYLWLKTPAYYGNGIRRVINMLVFVFRLFMISSRIVKEHKPDAVIASSTYPLDIFPAKYIARKSKSKLVYEVHDLWPLSPMELGGMSPWHPFIIVMQMAENYAYRVVDYVISMLPKAYRHMVEHGLAKHKFFYVPNGIDANEWKGNKEDIPEQYRQLFKRLKNDGHFIVCYAGSHGLSNALHYLIEAASLIKEHLITIILIGQGPEKDKLKNQVQDLYLNNVYFLPAVSKAVIPALLKQMDALYIGWNRVPIYRFGICPNKLFDYMMAAKPVIHSVEAGNDLVAESGCGISVPPEEPKEIAEAIIKLKNISQAERDTMGLKGREYILKNHEYKVLAKNFLEFLLK